MKKFTAQSLEFLQLLVALVPVTGFLVLRGVFWTADHIINAVERLRTRFHLTDVPQPRWMEKVEDWALQSID